MGRNIPCHIKYHFKIHNSDLATLLFIVVIYQPQSSLSPSSFCCEILITLHFQNPSSHCVVSAVSGGSLTILPVLYFKVFPSFFLLISSFFPQVSEKRTKPLYFQSQNIHLSLSFQALSLLIPSIFVIYISTLKHAD